MNVSMQLRALLPLTLTLSLGERERASTSRGRSPGGEHWPARPGILPLPEGEGWGEGKAGALRLCVRSRRPGATADRRLPRRSQRRQWACGFIDVPQPAPVFLPGPRANDRECSMTMSKHILKATAGRARTPLRAARPRADSDLTVYATTRCAQRSARPTCNPLTRPPA